MAGLFQGQDERLGMAQETTPRRGEDGTGAIAGEQPGTQPLFQVLDAGTDGGLGDMQARRRFKEAAVGGYGQKGAYLFDVHGEHY